MATVFTKRDVTHIASFKEGAFKSWGDIVKEVEDYRGEYDPEGVRQAKKALNLSFD